jgi:diguanylate cyclase (GGDEF)-like protein
MDGIRAAQEIKRRRQVPIVYLTASSDVETMARAVGSEPLGYIVKPYRELELRCAIEVALSRQKMEDALREREAAFRNLSLVDEMTGLHNRRGFCALAEQQLKAAIRSKQPLALFFADIDELKRINDAFGHAAGDQAIRETATVLRRTFRDADVIARLAGDEFVVLALDTAAAATDRMLARLRKNFAALNASSARSFRLEISAGATVCTAPGDLSVDALLARADAAMYEAKRRKRAGRSGPDAAGS